MEKRIISIVVAMVLAVVASCVHAQMYTCWGGCYNECFLRSNQTTNDRGACYYQCLNSCVPRSPADYQYYCQIGCNFEQCIPSTSDGGRFEKCLGRCNNLCKS